MNIDFKKELEIASRGMIMIHDPDVLIKLIIRMLVDKFGIKHAGVVVYVPEDDTYVLDISHEEVGIRISQGFTRFDKASPVITFFESNEFSVFRGNQGVLVCDDIWSEMVSESNSVHVNDLLSRLDEQMRVFDVKTCVPAYFLDKLIVVFLLGAKEDKSRFKKEEMDFFSALASDAAMAIRNAQLFKDLSREANRNHKQFLQIINVLGSIIEAKDAYTQGHAERVTTYSLAIANQMVQSGTAQFSKDFFENLYISALLHDIGKIGVPESILNKVESLTTEEYEIIKQHPLRGSEIIQPLDFTKVIIDGIKYHHERFDGGGYPQGLKGDDVPIVASIMAVADTFDAMTSDRPYRKGCEKHVSLKEIKNSAGHQFNPLVVNSILTMNKALNI